MKTSETMTSNDFYKARSYSGCIGAAFNLFCANFATLFKKTWMFALVFSVTCGLYAFVAFHAPTNAGQPMTLGKIALTTCAALTIVVCALVANSRTKAGFLSLTNGYTVKQNFTKHLKVTAILAACTIVVGIISLAANMGLTHFFMAHKTSASTAGTVLMCTSAAITFLFAMACLPFAYSATRLLMHNAKAKEMFGRHYHTGVKHLGFLFVIAIIVTLIILVINVFMALPAYITATASQMDSFGVQNGDPSGLPSYFAWLSFLTISIVSFILTYAMFWVDLVLCYAYGTIETEVAEEAMLHKNANETTQAD